MNAIAVKRLWGLALALCSAFALIGETAAAEESQAGNAIEQVEFSQISGQTLVKVTTRNPLSRAPEPYTLYSPQPKLFFDFPDTENASGVTAKQAGLADLQSLNVVQAGNRTRLVLNLNKSSQYRARLDGKVLVISLSQGGAAGVASATRAPSATQAAMGATQPSSVQNVDFRADSVDLATLRIEVADANPVIDVKRQASSLVLLLPNVSLPERLNRRWDVRDFGTPMITATATSAGAGSQIVISNRGDWDYSVTQLDNAIRVDVRRMVNDPTKLTGAKELQGKTISFNFTQPVPVSQMMGIFQDITGLNFVMMPGVTGEIERLKMENTPVETAINVISRMYGLGMRRYGDVVVVGKTADLAKYEKEDRDLQAARAEAEPIDQEAFKVRYRPVAEIVAALTGQPMPNSGAPAAANGTAPGASPGQQPGGAAAPAGTPGKSLISARGSISSDPVTNTIFIEETKSQLNKIRERIATLDRPIRQVMIEARIVSVSTDFSRTLGTKLSFLRLPNSGSWTGTFERATNNYSGVKTVTPPGTYREFSGGFDPNSAISTDLVANLFNSNQTRLLRLELEANEAEGHAKSIASPKILTQDGRQATITDGQTLYYQLSGGVNGPTTVAVDASTKLDVTPQINSDGKVTLKVDVNKGGVGTVTTNAGPSVTKQQVVTNVVVENGGTLMLGGVFTEVQNDNTTRLPLLGDLPYVGWLFKQKTKTTDRSELLIFLTPRVVTEELTLQ